MNTRLILFGATGDLAKAKILPALQTLGVEPLLYGRKPSELTNYIQGELEEITEKIEEKAITHAYVSLPPQYFEVVLRQLAQLSSVPGIALEKPFGTSYADAEKLAGLIHELALDGKVYLVDHYLGKPALVELLELSSEARQQLYRVDLIDSVEIDAFETNTVVTRGAFYDGVGTIRDFVQNHIMAIASTLLMQQGCEVSSTECRQQVLKHLSYKANSLILGQYQGFKETAGVAPDSRTETYVACEFLYNEILPIHIRVGKALHEARTEVRVKYKDGTKKVITIQSSVNSYEAIINDFLNGGSRFSLSQQEALLCWTITEQLLSARSSITAITYPQGSNPDDMFPSTLSYNS
ncbi:MAG: hypothetical protein RLY57_67 [Candidatus Parcubacteria bacterium]|jgi:glucose-6-phosphate 1-dehydrogenase